MCSDKRNFIYRVRKDHRNPGNRWNVNFRHGNIFKIWPKIEGPVILVLSEKLGQNHAQSVNLYLKLNSFCKGIGSYTNSPSLYRILLDLAQKSPCLQHRSPNPWILDLPAHFSQSSNMFSVYIMFSAQYFGSSGLKISKVDTLALKNIVYTEPFLIGNVFWLCLPTLWSIVLFLLSHELTKKLTSVG